MPMILVESPQEFAQRHGNDSIEISRWRDGERSPTGRWLFGDGAQTTYDGTRSEPPEDPSELLRLRRLYVSEQLERATSEFNSLKSECSEQAALSAKYSNLPSVDPGVVEELKSIKVRVDQYRAELQRLDAQLEQTPQAEKIKVIEGLKADRQRQAADLAATIKSIEL